MLTDRLNRIIAVSNLRQRKESRLARQAEAHAREMASLAREKQSLLEVLIHEVRQPLNNAQAALQHAMMTVDLDSSDGANGRRLQTIIDKIVLSLTNAIVGASVLERKSESRLVKTDIGSICELASGDAGLDWEDQIDLVSPLAPVYAEADPVLLRLAVRNLIDNAIKHSAPGRKTGVTIEHAAASGEIEIRVVNWPAEAFTPDRQLFERGVRGSNALSDGRGLGLYIAREIALLHHGSVQAHTNAHGQTEFVLAIRA
jgi:signal transduction histidine kinase